MPLDTASYLTSQGWKGKGTALRDGHSTRPLPTVVKRSMTGVGKDRDEAVPFWDNIFASAALNIKLSTPSGSPRTSGTSTPITQPSHSSNPPPATSSEVPSGTNNLNPHLRARREVVRRRLYSGFNRGAVLVDELPMQEPKPAIAQPSISPIESSSSSSTNTIKSPPSTIPDPAPRSLLKAEKQARRAERALRRQEKEVKRAKKAAAKEAVTAGIARARETHSATVGAENIEREIVERDQGRRADREKAVSIEGMKIQEKGRKRKSPTAHDDVREEREGSTTVKRSSSSREKKGKRSGKEKGKGISTPISEPNLSEPPSSKKRRRDKGIDENEVA